MRRFKATAKAGNAYYPESIAGIGESAERELLARAFELNLVSPLIENAKHGRNLDVLA